MLPSAPKSLNMRAETGKQWIAMPCETAIVSGIMQLQEGRQVLEGSVSLDLEGIGETSSENQFKVHKQESKQVQHR